MDIKTIRNNINIILNKNKEEIANMINTANNKKIEELNTYWQCPNCGYVNTNTIDNEHIIHHKKHSCFNCKKKYILQKVLTQILCYPYVTEL
jgi:predicted RNA-binding Zn-ribbon protein involved in translation (DUF1610 family)